MNKSFLAFLPLLVLAACVSGSVQDTVAVDNSLTIPGGLLPTDQSYIYSDRIQLDVSDAVSKLTKVGAPTIVLLQNEVDGDISWLSNLEVDLANDQGTLVLVNMPVNTTATVNQLPVSVDTAELLSFLSHPVSLHFTLTGHDPAKDTTITSHLLIGASESFSKRL